MLNGIPVTDAGLHNLRGLTQLQSLGLDDTRVTDAGLEDLKGLKSPHECCGSRGPTGHRAGVKKLQQALPRCKILR